MRKANSTFLDGPILPALLRFSIPVLCALLLQALYGAVDLWAVGTFCGEADVSAVATGSQTMLIVTGIVTGLSMGTTVLLGKKIGSEDRKGAADTIGTSICVFAILGVVLSVVMILAASKIAVIMNAPQEAFEKTVHYILICGAGSLFIVGYNLISAIFRGMGNSKAPLLFVSIACIANIIGDVTLIKVFNMGTAGAAIATIAAQGISVVLSLVLIKRKGLPFPFGKENIRLNKETATNIIKLGFPIALQDMCNEISYYISMVPLDAVAKIFQFADEELPPEIRAQRVLNKARIPEIRDYILSNPESYVFSALTVSVDGEMEFQAVSKDLPQIGTIGISMTSQFLINDGQHRRAAIAEAIKINPALKKEHISVVFYRDEGLLCSQQMFSDLNRYAIKPTKSINILFNSREESSIIAKRIIEEVDVFKGLVEKERTAISSRSKALFTLSAICTATNELLTGLNLPLQEKVDLAKQYWSMVGKYITEWNVVKTGEVKSADIRKDYICSLSLTLVALGYAGNTIIQQSPDTWESHLKKLADIDWRKTNPDWENLVFVNGRVAANRSTQKAMSSYMREVLMGTEGINNG